MSHMPAEKKEKGGVKVAAKAPPKDKP